MLEDEIGSFGGAWVQLKTVDDGTLEGEVINAESRDMTFKGEVIVNRKTKKPRREWVLTLQTKLKEGPDDDGVRRISLREAGQRAVAKATKDAGAKSLEVGGKLKLRVTENAPDSTSQATYGAQYTSPTSRPPF